MISDVMKTSCATDPESELSGLATVSDSSEYQNSLLNECKDDLETDTRLKLEDSSSKMYQASQLLAIYTEWANHYLEKAGFQNFVNDLQTDLCDGTLLADIIIAVTGEKVPNTKVKPKTQIQQMENLNSCLIFLSNIGVVTEGILSKDINEGSLKAILGLLFNLSRYKQQLKQQSSSASTPSAVSSNGSTLSGNNNVHKSNNRTSILRNSVTGIPTLSGKANEPQPVKPVASRKPDGLLCKKNINNNNNNSPDASATAVQPKRNSTIKTKKTDSASNSSSISSTYSTGIPLPANITNNTALKSSPLTGDCHPVSCSSNSLVLKKSSTPIIEPGTNMFDRFKLFRNSANERINRGSPLHSYSGIGSKDGGSMLISDPVAHRSMTPFDPRMVHNLNMNSPLPGSPGKMQTIPYSMFSLGTPSEGQFHQAQAMQPTFQNYNQNMHDNKFQPCAPIRSESAKQSASFKENNAQKAQGEMRKARSKESENSRMEPGTSEPPARSSSRHERQKAKDLYTALKQRDRNKYNFSPQATETCEQQTRESVNSKQSRIMTSEEFTQLIQNDPRLRQYVEKQSNAKRNLINLESSKIHCQTPSEVPRKQSIEVKPATVQNRAESENPNLSDLAKPESAASANINDKSRRKSLESKPKSNPVSKLDPSTYTNVMGKKEPLLWMQSRPSASGTDSSEYSSHYSCMRKYASDFEADFDLDSSVEMSTQTDKMTAKMGYYSDSDSILNPRFGKLDSCPNTDLSAIINQKMMGFRRLMNTSGMDPAAYLSYQKNLMASKRGTPQSADKDRIYGIVLNPNVARSAAGPAPATFDDLQLQSCFSLPSSQNFLRSNSARYSDTVSSEKSFPQTIKLPYATNTNSFIGKADTTDSSQNIGSNLSLTSNESRRSMSEDKQSQEIRKLRHELEIAQQKILTLSSRLTTNGHMASAFELSLMNMTERLQKLSETSERKDHELLQLRSIIDSFRQQGLNINEQASLASIGMEKTPGVSLGRSLSATVSPAHFQNSLGRMKNASNKTPSEYDSINNSIGLIGSSESCTSLVSTDIGSSNEVDQLKKQVKKGWFRSSLGKAFRKKLKHSDYSIPNMEGDYFIQQSPDCRSRMSHDSQSGQNSFTIDSSSNTIENLKKQLQERDLKLTDAQLDALSSAHQLEQLKELLNAMRCEMSTLRADNERLQKLVRVESDTNETNYNTGDEDSNKSIGTRSSMANKISDYLPDTGSSSASIETFSHLFKFSSPNEISIGTYVHFEDVIISTSTVQNITNKVLIGSCHISESSTWSQLETHIKCLFKEYLNFNDPFANLGINSESIEHYSIGSVQKRFLNEDNPNEADFPTPFQSLVDIESDSEANQIKLILRCTKLNNSVLDALAFDTLIPKTVLHRYVSLLLEHRLIILCGPSGTGKTYLANKLAKHLIVRNKQEVSSSTLAMFTVDHKSNKELRTYLTTIADQTQLPLDSSQSRNPGGRTPPVVVILDNLHHVNSLAEIFDSFLSSNLQNRPYVIGTMTQASFSNTNLQAHHNFRWVLCANHMEPVKGFLGRYLRRKLIQTEWQEKKHDDALLTTVEWISKVWQHINKFLESHSSSDVTIGPRLFLSCPMSMEGSQIWFTDLWNYSLVPYLLEAVREGLQTFGRRSNWEDPVDWILQTWPWTSSTVKTRNSDPSSLIRLRPEDVGYDSQVPLNISVTSSGSSNCQSAPAQIIPHSQHQKYLPDSRVISLSSSSPHRNINSNNTFPRTDPLLNMLLKLQEAANYSTSPSSNDSDKPSSKSNSLSRINSASNSAGQTSQIHKIFKTDIL